MMGRKMIQPGDRFGLLVVDKLYQSELNAKGKRRKMARCSCACGGCRDGRADTLLSGACTSCGCDARRQQNASSGRDGRSRTKLYSVWRHMIDRCTREAHPDYHRYGGRGITVHAEFIGPEGFEAYRAHVETLPGTGEIDRKDNDRGYEPGNLRRATRAVQQRNTGMSKRWIVDGVAFESRSLAAAHHGVSSATIMNWCNGFTRQGTHYPARENCHSESKYPPDEAT